MFSRIEPPPLDLKDPWKGDSFKRKEFANTLCTLLKSSSNSAVIGISAPFGFGKTFFLQRLREQIKNENGWVIYVNAWEYDYLDSALFALLDALKVAADELSDKKEVRKVLRSIGKAAAPAIAKAAGKKLLESLLGSDGSKDVIDAVGDASGKVAETLTNRFVKEDTTHQALDILRDEIRTFVASHINEQSLYKNLIVIVDELDRARPNFSIRFLETIKHIFSLSQVIFITGCDRSVLTSSAQHEYGAKLPIDGYLRRLFDYWIDLPPPNSKQYVLQCADRLNLISENIFSHEQRVGDSLQVYGELLFLGRRDDDVSLRFIEQSVAHAGVVLRLAPTDRHAGLIGWLQGLKYFAPQLHELYVSNGSLTQVFHELQKYDPFHNARTFFKAWILIWASNAKEPLTTETAEKLFGTPNEIHSIVKNIMYHIDVDDRESTACRIDRRLRMISVHIR